MPWGRSWGLTPVRHCTQQSGLCSCPSPCGTKRSPELPSQANHCRGPGSSLRAGVVPPDPAASWMPAWRSPTLLYSASITPCWSQLINPRGSQPLITCGLSPSPSRSSPSFPLPFPPCSLCEQISPPPFTSSVDVAVKQYSGGGGEEQNRSAGEGTVLAPTQTHVLICSPGAKTWSAEAAAWSTPQAARRAPESNPPQAPEGTLSPTGEGNAQGCAGMALGSASPWLCGSVPNECSSTMLEDPGLSFGRAGESKSWSLEVLKETNKTGLLVPGPSPFCLPRLLQQFRPASFIHWTKLSCSTAVRCYVPPQKWLHEPWGEPIDQPAR